MHVLGTRAGSLTVVILGDGLGVCGLAKEQWDFFQMVIRLFIGNTFLSHHPRPSFATKGRKMVTPSLTCC